MSISYDAGMERYARADLSRHRYTKGGKYFTRVGRAKAKGVQALRPTLQLQNSYDVHSLTTNSMKERPLVVSGQKKSKKSKG